MLWNDHRKGRAFMRYCSTSSVIWDRAVFHGTSSPTQIPALAPGPAHNAGLRFHTPRGNGKSTASHAELRQPLGLVDLCIQLASNHIHIIYIYTPHLSACPACAGECWTAVVHMHSRSAHTPHSPSPGPTAPTREPKPSITIRNRADSTLTHRALSAQCMHMPGIQLAALH